MTTTVKKIVLTIRTKQKRFYAKKETGLEFYTGRHKWTLANPNPEKLEGGLQGIFDLPIPSGMTLDWIRFLCFKRIGQKSGDDWLILELKLEVNGKTLYHNPKLEAKIKMDSTSWCASDYQVKE